MRINSLALQNAIKQAAKAKAQSIKDAISNKIVNQSRSYVPKQVQNLERNTSAPQPKQYTPPAPGPDSTKYCPVPPPHSPSLMNLQKGSLHQKTRTATIPDNLDLSPVEKVHVYQSVHTIQNPVFPPDIFFEQVPAQTAIHQSTQINIALENQSAEVQEAILMNIQPELENIGNSFSYIDQESSDQVVSELSQAAEKIGLSESSQGGENIQLLTQPIAQGLDAEEWQSGFRTRKLAQSQERLIGENGTDGSLGNAIKNGEGSLFTAALALSLHNENHEVAADQTIMGSMLFHSRNVRESYENAETPYIEKQGQLFFSIAQNPLYSEIAVAAGVENFHRKHHEVYGNYEDASQRLSANQNGAAYILAHSSSFQEIESYGSILEDPEEHTRLVDEAEKQLSHLPALIQNNENLDEQISSALIREGQGHKTFLSVASEHASSHPEYTEAFNHAIMYSTAKATDSQVNTILNSNDSSEHAQNYEKIAQLFQGASQVTPQNTLQNQQIHDIYSDFALMVDKELNEIKISDVLDAGNEAFTLAEEFPQNVNQLLKTQYREIPSHIANGFRSMSVGLGIADLGVKSGELLSDPNIEDATRVAIDAAELTEHLPFNSAQFIGRAGFYASLGFSAWDTYHAIKDGDNLAAISAAAPLVGAAACAPFGGPPAAGTCAAIGSLVGFGINFVRAWGGDPNEKNIEESTQSFHEGALKTTYPELDQESIEDIAYRFRNISIDQDQEEAWGWQKRMLERTGFDREVLLNTMVFTSDEDRKETIKAYLD